MKQISTKSILIGVMKLITQADVVDTLTKARELVKIGWIQSAWARNKAGTSVDPWSEEACEWCTEGAILAVTHYHPQNKQLADACVRILQAGNAEFTDIVTLMKTNIGNHSGSVISGHSTVPAINDSKRTNKQKIVRFFTHGILLAKGAKWPSDN